jgi:ATP-dependent DNA helicase RecG
LLLNHIKDNAEEGVKLADLGQVLPSLSISTVQQMLRQLKVEGRVDHTGRTKAARWYPST